MDTLRSSRYALPPGASAAALGAQADHSSLQWASVMVRLSKLVAGQSHAARTVQCCRSHVCTLWTVAPLVASPSACSRQKGLRSAAEQAERRSIASCARRQPCRSPAVKPRDTALQACLCLSDASQVYLCDSASFLLIAEDQVQAAAVQQVLQRGEAVSGHLKTGQVHAHLLSSASCHDVHISLACHPRVTDTAGRIGTSGTYLLSCNLVELNFWVR